MWFENALSPTFNEIINENSQILNFIEKKYINLIKETGNIQYISKIVTTEIILNLIKSKWDIEL